MFNFKPTTYLWISVFCFFMALTSAVCFLFVEQPTSFLDSFMGYGICTVAFFGMGMAKGLE